MEFIRVQDYKIVELVSSAESLGDVWIPVDISGGVHVGHDTRWFTSDWKLRPIGELLSQGLLTLRTDENGRALEKVHDGQIVAKTEYDFVKEGLLSLIPLQYLDDESETIKLAASTQELLQLGKASPERAAELEGVLLREQRGVKLACVDAVVMNPLRWGTLTLAQQQTIAAYRQALLDVPQQAGFPWVVDWPVAPSALPSE